jgi:hypothetical protein
VATDELEDDHATARPPRTLPCWSLVIAASDVVRPATIEAEPGLTVTAATGTSVTVTVAEPVFPSLVAVIVAVPAETPVTVPFVLTDATWLELLAQITVLPVRTLREASYATAFRVTVPLTVTLALAGAIATDATATGTTATGTTADCPPELAATCVFPTPVPVTTPADDTVATVVSALDQNTVAPGTVWPAGSCTCACSAICVPSVTAGGALGRIAIVAGVPPEGGGATESDAAPLQAIIAANTALVAAPVSAA